MLACLTARSLGCQLQNDTVPCLIDKLCDRAQLLLL